MSKLLIKEPPLQVLPSLAIAVGLNEAIVLQQLHYLLLDPTFGRKIEAHRWIFNTVEEWRCRYFPFWSARTIKTIFANLARMDLIITCQPEGRISRRKYYRINLRKLDQISDGAKFVPSMGQQSSHGNGQKSSLPITKTTAETSSQRKVKGALHSQRHSHGFSPKYPYPESEEEMAETLEIHDIEYNPDYDGNFFETMEKKNWTIRGKPVFDWIETYTSRLEVTSPSGS